MTTYILGASLEDRSGIRGLGAQWRKIQRQALQEMARYYHAKIFPKHFNPTNSSRYSYKQRTEFYRKIVKPFQGAGQGKYVDLQLKGESRRNMTALATFTGTAERAVVTMRPPAYFTNPFVGTYRDRGGQSRTVRQQPDKVAEVTTITQDEREQLQAYLAKRINQLITQARRRAT